MRSQTFVFIAALIMSIAATAEQPAGVINPLPRPPNGSPPPVIRGENAPMPVVTPVKFETREGITYLTVGAETRVIPAECVYTEASKKPYKLANLKCGKISVDVPERITKEIILATLFQSKDWKDVLAKLDDIGKRLDGMPETTYDFIVKNPKRLTDAIMPDGTIASREYVDGAVAALERRVRELEEMHKGQQQLAAPPPPPSAPPPAAVPNQGSSDEVYRGPDVSRSEERAPPAAQHHTTPAPPAAQQPDYWERQRQQQGAAVQGAQQAPEVPFGDIPDSWGWKERKPFLSLNLGRLTANGIEVGYRVYFGDDNRFVFRPAAGLGYLTSSTLGEHTPLQFTLNLGVGYRINPRMEGLFFIQTSGLNPFKPLALDAPGFLLEYRVSDQFWLGGRVSYVVPTKTATSFGTYPNGDVGVGAVATVRL